MQLSPGDKFGPYRFRAVLPKGEMGEVRRASIIRFDRS